MLNIPHCLRKWRYAISLTTCIRCIISLVVYGKEWCTISFNLQENYVVLRYASQFAGNEDLLYPSRNMYYIPYSLQELRCILSLTAYGKLYVALFIYPTVYRKGRCSISLTVYWKWRCSISLTVHKKQRCSISLTVYWKRRYSQFIDN